MDCGRLRVFDCSTHPLTHYPITHPNPPQTHKHTHTYTLGRPLPPPPRQKPAPPRTPRPTPPLPLPPRHPGLPPPPLPRARHARHSPRRRALAPPRGRAGGACVRPRQQGQSITHNIDSLTYSSSHSLIPPPKQINTQTDNPPSAPRPLPAAPHLRRPLPRRRGRHRMHGPHPRTAAPPGGAGAAERADQ